MEKLEFTQLIYPNMREELIEYLHKLGNKEYQNHVWAEGHQPTGSYDELDYAIHFLYDDTGLANDPQSTIGWFLTGKEEADVIANLVKALEIVFDKYGTELSDKEYIEKPEWKNVISMARKAERLFLTKQ